MSAGLVRFIFDGFIMKYIAFKFGDLVCFFLIKDVTGYDTSACPSLKNQYQLGIYPEVFDELFSELKFCSFLFNVC